MSSYSLSDTVMEAIASHVNARYPLVHKPVEKKLTYGTAGFRTTGTVLPPVAARVVIIAILRAWQCTDAAIVRGHTYGSTVGFMITASHNPAQDNGFKIIDEDGGMLTPSWEPWCGKMANAVTGEEVAQVVRECMEAEKVSVPTSHSSHLGSIQLGRDTRGSGEAILAAAKDILDTILGVSYTDHGIATTPQLHFVVYKANQRAVQDAKITVNVDLYCEEILTAFDSLMEICAGAEGRVARKIVVDAANGVGFNGLHHLLEYAKSHCINGKTNAIAQYVDIAIVNTLVEDPDALNKDCGAEFAHKKQRPSDEMQKWAHGHNDNNDTPHFYCLDGDADRLISFAHATAGTSEATWTMLDGDRMSILYAMALHHWLGKEAMSALDVGIVQTAYANGASTTYVEQQLLMKVYMGATGVKNLHPIAHARDIGVYFEANGHGTVLLKDHVAEKLAGDKGASVERLQKILQLLPKLLSQVCGDAIADMLMCEVALRTLNLTPNAWAALYADHPSLQTTVTVSNPRVITNTKDETRALTPPGLQEAIDGAVQKCREAMDTDAACARSFVRPSGTEPIVRVYAEATTRESTDGLADDVKQLVLQFCS